MIKRFIAVTLTLALLLGARSEPASAQLQRPAIGAAVGVLGGGVITLSAVVARARFKREYVDSMDDLIHWQSLPMLLTPAVGIGFGLAGDEALKGSVIGSTSGMVVGAAVGSGLAYVLSEAPEWPWAGAVIGAGAGLTIGGLYYGLRKWEADDDPAIAYPEVLRLGITVPLAN
jgi:hypothetical protein